MRPLKIEALMDQEVQNLSGGELQRVAMTLCLGKPADVYLIDEPSAYLDSEQRLAAAKVMLKWFYRYNTDRLYGYHNLSEDQLLILFLFIGDKEIYFACQEDRICGRARFHYGNISC